MARKYGFVNAADVKIAGVRGANAHSASFRSARATNKPLSTVSYPKTTQPGAQWAGMGHAIGLAAMSMWGSVSGSGDSGDNTDTIRGMSSGTSRGGGGRGRQPALSTSQKVGIKIGTNIGRRIRGGNAVDTPRAVETPSRSSSSASSGGGTEYPVDYLAPPAAARYPADYLAPPGAGATRSPVDYLAPPGRASAAPTAVQPAPESYYQAPVAMGANVPLSRQKKFAQGSGL